MSHRDDATAGNGRPPSPQDSRGTHVPGRDGTGGGDGDGAPGGGLRRAGLILLGVIGFAVVLGILFPPLRDGGSELPYSPTFLEQVREGNVERVRVEGQEITGTLAQPLDEGDLPAGDGGGTPAVDGEAEGGVPFTTTIPPFADEEELAALLRDNDVVITAVQEDEGGGSTLLWLLLLSFLPVLLIIGFFVYMARKAGGGMGGRGGPLGRFGQSRARRVKPSREDVSFDDVAGIDEAKGELEELVDFLKNPKRYRRLGGRIPRGVLLSGEPGTGKTLLARAVAGEAGAPFFSISASEFVEAFVGVGASRVRDMFAEAKKHAPAIVFIDELDAVGRRRSGGGGMSGGNDEREQTLNQILTEMDGFEQNETVIVLGATNRPDDLDEALTRPGRFDRQVPVQAPDKEGRHRILKVHTRSLPLADDVDLGALAASVPGMVGADLANLANEAALLAARRRADEVTMDDFQAAIEKVALGVPRGIVLSEEDRRLTAYHEAGHAIVGMLTPGADPVRKVSIVPRGRALGVTLAAPDADRVSYRRAQLRARMLVTLGGRAAEEIAFDDVTTGAEDDLEQVTNIARMMVARWGMGDLGPLSLLPREASAPWASRAGEPSDLTQRRVDEAVERLVLALHEEAVELLRGHRDRLDALAEALLRDETLNEDAAYEAAGIGREVARAQPVGAGD